MLLTELLGQIDVSFAHFLAQNIWKLKKKSPLETLFKGLLHPSIALQRDESLLKGTSASFDETFTSTKKQRV